MRFSHQPPTFISLLQSTRYKDIKITMADSDLMSLLILLEQLDELNTLQSFLNPVKRRFWKKNRKLDKKYLEVKEYDS